MFGKAKQLIVRTKISNNMYLLSHKHKYVLHKIRRQEILILTHNQSNQESRLKFLSLGYRNTNFEVNDFAGDFSEHLCFHTFQNRPDLFI